MLTGEQWNSRNHAFWVAYQPTVEQRMCDPLVAEFVREDVNYDAGLVANEPSEEGKLRLLRQMLTFEATLEKVYERKKKAQAPLRGVIARQRAVLADQAAAIAAGLGQLAAFEQKLSDHSERQRAKAKRPRRQFKDRYSAVWSLRKLTAKLVADHPDASTVELWDRMPSKMGELGLDPDLKGNSFHFNSHLDLKTRTLSRRTFDNLVSQAKAIRATRR